MWDTTNRSTNIYHINGIAGYILLDALDGIILLSLDLYPDTDPSKRISDISSHDLFYRGFFYRGFLLKIPGKTKKVIFLRSEPKR